MKLASLIFGAFVGAVLPLGGTAYASLVDFKFTDTISSATTTGIAVGDTFTLNLLADNGGSSLANQTWNLSDLKGFTITAGSYSASYSAVWTFPTTGNFTTDAAGNVSSVQFYGTDYSSNNVDNFGSWTADTVFGNASFVDFLGNGNTVSANGFDNAAQWTVAAVPETSTWVMMLAGFAALGFAGYRRGKAATLAA